MPLQPLREDHSGERLIFVVGDAHGQADLLEDIIEQIENYKLAKKDKVIFLGGLCSQLGNVRNAIALLRTYEKERPDNVVILNNSADFRMIKSKDAFFKSFEGRRCVDSYKRRQISVDNSRLKGDMNVRGFVNDRKWLMTHKSFFETKSFFVVPSGLNPMYDIDNQKQGALMFLKDPFFHTHKKFGKKIVHGNNAQSKIEVRANRIGIDTYSPSNPTLSAVVLEDHTCKYKGHLWASKDVKKI